MVELIVFFIIGVLAFIIGQAIGKQLGIWFF